MSIRSIKMQYLTGVISVMLLSPAFSAPNRITFEAGDGTGKAERIETTGRASTASASAQEQWKIWRREWIAQKKGAMTQMIGLPEMEQHQRHRAWLLYQAPPEEKIFQYLRFEDLFILSTKLADWKSAKLYLDEMSAIAPDVPYGIESLVSWLNQMKSIPVGMLDRTKALNSFKNRWEQEKKYDALAYFFADSQNPVRDAEAAKHYAQLYSSSLPQLDGFKWTTRWSILSANNEETAWFLQNENHPLMVYWWATKISLFCQNLKQRAPLSPKGELLSSSCTPF